MIGLYAEPANIFAPPGQEVGAIIPFQMHDHQYKIDKTNALYIPVKPRPGVSVVAAQEAVTMALRATPTPVSRKLRAPIPNRVPIADSARS